MKRRRIAGGDINDAYAVELDDGTLAFEKTRDGGGDVAHTRSAERSSPSRPRQAACTWSSTVSNPRSPP